MAVKVDLAQKKIWAAVQDLLPTAVGWGWPGEGRVRLSVGSQLHRLVQARLQASEEAYTPEVDVQVAWQLGEWLLSVHGRCDGVFRPEQGLPIVEEIKTLSFRTDLFRPNGEELRERFAWQARLYAYSLFPSGEAKARLRLVDLGGEEEQLQEVPWSPQQVQAYLRGKVAVLVRQAQEREQVLARLRAAAQRLVFPFPEIRPGQREALQAVARAVEEGSHLLLAAPTGVGKTAAALFPALRHALASGKRLVVATAKTLQQKLAVQTLAAMNDGSFRSLQIRAKSKMCAHHEMVCHEEFCPFLQNFASRLASSSLVERLLQRSHLDPGEVFSAAKEEELCPFAVQLELLPTATAVVCDYNYVFDPGIALFGGPEEGILPDTILVVDEAHNLVDRAREYFSPKLTRKLLASALAITQAFPTRICRQLTEVLTALDETVKGCVEEALGEKVGVAKTEPPMESLREARLALDALMVPYFSFKRQQELWLASDPVVEVLLTLARLHNLAEDPRPQLVALAERRGPEEGQGPWESLRLLCLDPAPFLSPLLAACASCVAMSATLEPFEFYRDLLGFDPERTATLSVPSPFPKENRLVAVVESVDTSYRRRAQAFGPLAELIPQLLPPGKNSLVLFPSYRFLQEVASRLLVESHQVLIQGSEDPDSLREEMLAALHGQKQAILLLGVLGGVFAEGVDYPGDALSQVIVVSPGLPQVSPERELLQRYFDDKLGRGFAYAYLIPGMTRVVQAAGRLIRSPEDRGVIVLVCRRFLQEPYFSLLPVDWTQKDPENLRIPQLPQAIARFFANP